ncbi:MAG: nicotinate (nicotinamide) nucleotide adenylyltransferase, partial [Candidatus Gastranaerophilales bacterium]|nr:nicotinate (nicotinamide) nucleotide adenylyltransferase [Candidatus Gastranaerophilales bacterium]
AEYVLNHYNFDKLVFIPAANPPHKDCDLQCSGHRLKMAELAALTNPKFAVSDIEYRREGKSYTYLTIKELYKTYGKVSFIIGTDAFKKIESWYETDKLKKLVKFIVFIREDKFDISEYDYLKDKGYEFEFQSLPYQDISSTELREKIKKGEDIKNLVPSEVEEYIERNGLYKD